jgi:hypothetical protein
MLVCWQRGWPRLFRSYKALVSVTIASCWGWLCCLQRMSNLALLIGYETGRLSEAMNRELSKLWAVFASYLVWIGEREPLSRLLCHWCMRAGVHVGPWVGWVESWFGCVDWGFNNAAVSICQCSYHLNGNADNSITVPICPRSNHDPMEIPEPSSNHNTIHLGEANDGAYFPVLEKF